MNKINRLKLLLFNWFQLIIKSLLRLIGIKVQYFICPICERMLLEENRSLVCFEHDDQEICIDCWQSKYREEIIQIEANFYDLLLDLFND